MCPWCRIGARRFGRAWEAFDGADEVGVVYRPFQLDPSAPETAEPIHERLERKYGADASRILEQASAAAAEEGLEMRWDEAQSVNTFRAHRLMEWVLARSGPAAQRALADVLFSAHFERGADVSDPETLAESAAVVGLASDAARDFVASDEGADATRAEVERALRMGIRSVPTFVFEDQWAVEGAQPTDTFAAVLEKVRGELASES